MPEKASAARFVPEAADSKLVTSESFGEDIEQEHVMRLRLHVATRLLFGEEIVIPQGWAIDSIGLFQVVKEVEEAINNLRTGRRPAGLTTYSPFKMECHADTVNYLEVLERYLRRDDCVWSGLPPLRKSRDMRQKVSRLIGPTIREPEAFSATAFARAATEIIGDEGLAYAWGKTVEYFSLPGSQRILSSKLPRNAFINQVLDILPVGDDAHDAVTDSKALRPELVKFRYEVKSRSEALPDMPTSTLISLAEDRLEPDAVSLVKLISTFAQTQVAAAATDSASSAPMRSVHDAEWRHLVDGLMVAGLGAKADVSSIYVAPGLEVNSQVTKRLTKEKVNWTEVWSHVIRLAHNEDWKKLARSLRRKALPWHPSYEPTEYRKMTVMLENECPELVIKQSGLEGLFLYFNVPLPQGVKRGIESVVDNVVTTGSKLSVGAGAGFIAHLTGMSLVGDFWATGITTLVTPGLRGASLNPARIGEIGTRVIPVFSPKRMSLT